MNLGLRTLAFATTFATGFSIAPGALAQPAPDSAGTTPTGTTADNQRGLRGFEALLRPGFGSAGGASPVQYQAAPLVAHPDPGSIYAGSASPYGGGFAGQLALGYRFVRW